MIVIPPRSENDILTEQEKHRIREQVKGCLRAGCELQSVVDVFGLKDGELEEIVNENDSAPLR